MSSDFRQWMTSLLDGDTASKQKAFSEFRFVIKDDEITFYCAAPNFPYYIEDLTPDYSGPITQDLEHLKERVYSKKDVCNFFVTHLPFERNDYLKFLKNEESIPCLCMGIKNYYHFCLTKEETPDRDILQHISSRRHEHVQKTLFLYFSSYFDKKMNENFFTPPNASLFEFFGNASPKNYGEFPEERLLLPHLLLFKEKEPNERYVHYEERKAWESLIKTNVLFEKQYYTLLQHFLEMEEFDRQILRQVKSFDGFDFGRILENGTHNTIKQCLQSFAQPFQLNSAQIDTLFNRQDPLINHTLLSCGWLNREQIIQTISSEDEISNYQNFLRFSEEDLSNYNLPQKTYWHFLEDAKYRRDNLLISRIISNLGFQPEPEHFISLYDSQGIEVEHHEQMLRRTDIHLPEDFLSQKFEFFQDYPFGDKFNEPEDEHRILFFIETLCQRPDFFPTHEKIKKIEAIAEIAPWIQDTIQERRGAWDAHLLKQSFPSPPSKKRTL